MYVCMYIYIGLTPPLLLFSGRLLPAKDVGRQEDDMCVRVCVSECVCV